VYKERIDRYERRKCKKKKKVLWNEIYFYYLIVDVQEGNKGNEYTGNGNFNSKVV